MLELMYNKVETACAGLVMSRKLVEITVQNSMLSEKKL